MSVHHLARTRSLYCPSRRVPKSSDLSLTAMQACSGWCPPPTYRLLNAPSDLHRPLRRAKCTTIPNGVCFQYLFLTTSPIHLHLYISRWESPPYTSTQFSVPDNWKSGRIWVRIFSPALSPLVPGCIPADVLRARTRASFLVGFQGRRDCNFTTTSGVNSCLDGGCNGGLQCDPHTGTVRLSPTIFTYTQTHTSSLSPLPFPGRLAGCTARDGGGMDTPKQQQSRLLRWCAHVLFTNSPSPHPKTSGLNGGHVRSVRGGWV